MMAARRLVGFLRHESDFGCMKMHPWFFDITVARRSQTCRIGGAFSTWSAVAEFEGIRANADTALEAACRPRGQETKTGFQRRFPRGRRAPRAISTGRVAKRRNSKIVPEMLSCVQFSPRSDPGRVWSAVSNSSADRGRSRVCSGGGCRIASLRRIVVVWKTDQLFGDAGR